MAAAAAVAPSPMSAGALAASDVAAAAAAAAAVAALCRAIAELPPPPAPAAGAGAGAGASVASAVVAAPSALSAAIAAVPRGHLDDGDGAGRSPLWHAVRAVSPAAVRALLAAGASPARSFPASEPAAHAAIAAADWMAPAELRRRGGGQAVVDVLRALLTADSTPVDAAALVALATEAGLVPVVTFLNREHIIRRRRKARHLRDNAMVSAAGLGHLGLIVPCLDLINVYGYSFEVPAAAAMASGHAETMLALLKLHTDGDEHGYGFYIGKECWSLMDLAVSLDRPECVRLLHAWEPRMWCVYAPDGLTPVMRAAALGRVACLGELLPPLPPGSAVASTGSSGGGAVKCLNGDDGNMRRDDDDKVGDDDDDAEGRWYTPSQVPRWLALRSVARAAWSPALDTPVKWGRHSRCNYDVRWDNFQLPPRPIHNDPMDEQPCEGDGKWVDTDSAEEDGIEWELVVPNGGPAPFEGLTALDIAVHAGQAEAAALLLQRGMSLADLRTHMYVAAGDEEAAADSKSEDKAAAAVAAVDDDVESDRPPDGAGPRRRRSRYGRSGRSVRDGAAVARTSIAKMSRLSAAAFRVQLARAFGVIAWERRRSAVMSWVLVRADASESESWWSV